MRNLLKSRRQVLHRRIAEILRDRFAAIPAAEPELLAHYFAAAGLTEAAVEWWARRPNAVPAAVPASLYDRNEGMIQPPMGNI